MARLSTELISSVAFFLGSVAVLLAWPMERKILLECLFHPLRKAVVIVDEEGRIVDTVVEVDDDGRHEWERAHEDKAGPKLEVAHTGEPSRRRTGW